MKGVLVLGAGGHARQVMTVYQDLMRFDEIIGLVEENSSKVGVRIMNRPILDSSVLDIMDPSDVILMNGMGSTARRRWIGELEEAGFRFDQLIHPSVRIRDSVSIGEGTLISQGVSMTVDIIVGKHTIVNLNSTVGHDSIIGNYVTISPGVNIAGNVAIGDGTWIGIGAVVIEKVSIGNNSYIGAGAVVVDDIPDNTVAYGVPAKPKKKVQDWASEPD